MMSIPRGDFIGFTIDGIHSSELGLIRTSDGSRFSENLLPEFSDKTVQVPGGDGFYYFGRQYNTLSFNLNVAFDNLREDQIRRIKQIFYSQKKHELILDECPYKIYDVVVNGTPQLKYLCFDDEIGQRVYKGEGTIGFISYMPYGRSRYKYIEDYEGKVNNTLPDNMVDWSLRDSNLDEWIQASGLKYRAQVIQGQSRFLDRVFLPNPLSSYAKGCYVYNPGDLKTPLKIVIPFQTNKISNLRLSLSTGEKMYFDTITKADDDNYIVIDAERGIIIGSSASTAADAIAGDESGNLYNRYIASGDFIYLSPAETINTLAITSGDTSPISRYAVKYDYRYL